MSKPVKVYMGLPSTGNRVDAQCYVLRQLEKDYAGRVEMVYPEICTRRIFHDFARNGIVEEFLKSDCDILWFLDSDVVPSKEVFDLITEHGDMWELAGCVYPIWLENKIVFTAYKQRDDGAYTIAEVPQSGIGFVDGLATGCLFMRRAIFEDLEKPYFSFKFDKEDRCMKEGEDMRFARTMCDRGKKFFTDFSMACRHYKTVDLLDMNNYAIEHANAQVIAYDKTIRGQVEGLVQKVSEKMKSPSSAVQNKSGLILPESYR